jgi:Kef-type K+ transport system membrane component KefB
VSAGAPAGPGRKALEAGALALLVALSALVVRAAGPPVVAWGDAVFAVGVLLLGGSIGASVLELVGLPHITGYLLAGGLLGPHALNVAGHGAVEDLLPVNALALSLIALAGGAELRLDSLRRGLRSLAWATLYQSSLPLVAAALAFVLARPLLPFARGLPLSTVWGVGLLWGVLAITRSPSATLGILAQTRAEGTVARFTVNFVMTSDVVVVVVLALVSTVAWPLVIPGTPISLGAFGEVAHELVGSLALGVTIGLLLTAYLRFVGRQFLLVLAALGLVLTHVLDYLRFDWLLIFIAAGFVVQNLSRQGPRLLHAVEGTGEVVYVVFFATAGAHLDLPLLAELWPLALLFAGVRGAATVLAGWLAARAAGDPAVLRRWGHAGLLSQAGLALGIAANVAKELPGFGPSFGALAIATVAVNEVAGPLLFSAALSRAGETAPAAGGRAAVDPGAAMDG